MNENLTRMTDELPIYTAKVGSDGGLRGDWMDTAEHIADTEGRIALWWRNPASRGSPLRDGQDHLEPAFMLLGSRESSAFIGEAISGITKHGHAFAAWARHVGGDPEKLRRFDDAYLGRFESTEAFVRAAARRARSGHRGRSRRRPPAPRVHRRRRTCRGTAATRRHLRDRQPRRRGLDIQGRLGSVRAPADT